MDSMDSMEIIWLKQTTTLYVLHIIAENFEFLGNYNCALKHDRIQICKDAQRAEAGTFIPTDRDLTKWYPIPYVKLNTMTQFNYKNLLKLNKKGYPTW